MTSREPYIYSIAAADGHFNPDHWEMIAVRIGYAGLKGDQLDVDYITADGAVSLIIDLSIALSTLRERTRRREMKP